MRFLGGTVEDSDEEKKNDKVANSQIVGEKLTYDQ